MPRDLDVTVFWSPPNSIEYLRERLEVHRDRVYAIVGRPPPGSQVEPVTFYIGQTRRHTGDRLRDRGHKFERIVAAESRQYNVKVRVGRIEPGTSARVTAALVNDIEALLIGANQPSYNQHYPTPREGTVASIENVTAKGTRLVDEIADWSAPRHTR